VTPRVHALGTRPAPRWKEIDMATVKTRHGQGARLKRGHGISGVRWIGLVVAGYLAIAGAVFSISSSNEPAGGALGEASALPSAVPGLDAAGVFLGIEPRTSFIDLIQPRECEADAGIVSACVFL
jgi:hypothetical protein